MSSKTSITIATRKSPLALAQARQIQSQLMALYPNCAIDLLAMTTEGDRQLNVDLSSIGGKGLFIKNLEEALIAGKADIAVHSLKDVPVALEKSFTLAAVTQRANALDAFVSNRFSHIQALPEKAVIGTSSSRRALQLKRYYPHLMIRPLRGNIGTRLQRLDEGAYDAIILAAAGLERLDLTPRIKALFPVDIMVPAPGQGALAIECLSERFELIQKLEPLNDLPTQRCIEAERLVSQQLGGTCHLPFGAYAFLEKDEMTLSVRLMDPDSLEIFETIEKGPADQMASLAFSAAKSLLNQGAQQTLVRFSNA